MLLVDTPGISTVPARVCMSTYHLDMAIVCGCRPMWNISELARIAEN